MTQKNFTSPNRRAAKRGFTLIELSIVLVIIGLIVGGVLVGQDLIAAAAVRAQISQIEKYNTAVNTFKSKYGYLPGDIPDPAATSFGFVQRGAPGPLTAGLGDGNGILQGIDNSNVACNTCEGSGELLVFWRDLSDAHLIDAGFSTAINTWVFAVSPISLLLPTAKIGRGNYVYVYSGGPITQLSATIFTEDGPSQNYFGLSAVTSFASNMELFSNAGLTVNEAYNIDRKVDDGLPASGRVQAAYMNWFYGPSTANIEWSDGNTNSEIQNPASALSFAATNCFDNAGVAGAPKYQLKNANLINCSLSFKFQ